MRFAYARRGGPLLDWSGPTPPHQSRAGETRSLGDFYPTTHNSNALRRYGGRSPGHGGSAIGYEHNRALGVFYPTTRTSSALRRYGGRSPGHGGSAIGYEHNRQLGYWGAQTAGHGGAGYRPPHMLPTKTLLGDLYLPRPGAPEVVEGYESPEPGAAVIHLGGYMPEGAARAYGQTMLSADAPVPSPVNVGGLVRKAGILAAAYHGVKRNNGSILSGLLWALSAWAAFPFYGTIVPAIAVAQGFAQQRVRSNPARRYRRRRARR